MCRFRKSTVLEELLAAFGGKEPIGARLIIFIWVGRRPNPNKNNQPRPPKVFIGGNAAEILHEPLKIHDAIIVGLRESFTYKTIGEADFNSLLREGSDKPFLVVFTAEWLGEGTIMDAIIEGLAADYEGQVGFYRMDVEESKNISHQMGIRRLPAIYLFKHGEIADHFSGMVPARTIQQHIEQLLS